MRKAVRLSIMLIALGFAIFPEAFLARVGEGSGEGTLRTGVPYVSQVFFLWRGQVMTGNVTASSQVDFFIVDETNHLSFAKGQQWHPLVSLLGVTNQNFNFVAPNTGYYRYIVQVSNKQTETEERIFYSWYDIDRDHFDAGLALIVAGTALGICVLPSSLKSRNNPLRRKP